MTQRWASDAADIQIGEDLGHLVYRNQAVRDFVEGDNKHFLSASKGMGKTLLLTFKRYELERVYRTSEERPETAVRFVPGNRPYLDFMADLPSLGREWKDYVGDISNSTRIWAFALRLSALSNAPSPPRDEQLLDELPARIGTWVAEGSGLPPSVFCHELLQLSISQFNRLYDSTWNALGVAVRGIHSGLFFFLDKVDQAAADFSRQPWVAFQVGLIMAAAALNRSNAHVRIYASVRQEAWANFESPTRANVSSLVTELSYSQDDLKRMLDGLTGIYEKRSCFEDFVGLREVVNSRARCREESFRYLYRHTLGRPRDLVRIAETLSVQGAQLNEESFKQTVNATSAELIGREAFSEVGVFLEALRSRKTRGELFASVPYNVLSREELEEICRSFNRRPDLENFHEDGIDHPFCELYCAGLLGVVRRGMGDDEWVQHFKAPDESLNPFSRDLPVSPYYFVHPGLQNIVTHARPDYAVFRFIAVGDGYPWTPRIEAMANAQRALHRIVSEGGQGPSDLDLEALAKRVMEEIHELGRRDPGEAERPEDRLSGDWHRLRELSRDHQELRELDFWLEAAIYKS